MPQSRSHSEPIAITGAGLATSVGLDCASTWRKICAGVSGIRPLTALEQTPAEEKGGGQALDLPGNYFPDLPREARYLRHAIDEAIAKAGIEGDTLPYPASRCGVLLGTTLHGMRAAGRFIRQDDPEQLASFLAPSTIAAATGGRFTGISASTTCSACSSGLAAIGMAVSLLRSGQLDLVIAGGYDVISEYAYAGFESLRLVARGPLRPFCLNREGMKLGEGFGIVVLERVDDARLRDVEAMAHIVGCGESADAHHLTQPHPEGSGASLAISRALGDGGIDPQAVDLIAAHATSTPDNDVGEYAALKSVLGEHLRQTPVTALKSLLGHTLGGAGAVELIISAIALREGVVPPTLNVTAEELEYDGLNLHARPRPCDSLKRSMNLSIGFGGANACVVLSRPDIAKPRVKPAAPKPAQRVCISGVGVLLPGAMGNGAFTRLLQQHEARMPLDSATQIERSELDQLLVGMPIRRLSEYARLTVAASRLACEDAGLNDREDMADTSAILGTCHGSADYSERYYRELVEHGLAAGNPMLFAEGVPNAGAAHLTIMLGLRGGSQTIIGSRTSAIEALNLAQVRIASGEADRVIICAAEENVAVVREAYAHCGLHHPDGQPSGVFSDESGFCCSSGAAAIVLESEAAAARRGAAIRGYVGSGYCASFNAHNRRQAIKLMRSSFESLGRFDYVIGSANNTWIDRAEAIALAGTGITLGSIYGRIGEAFSVNPLAGLAAVLLTGRMPALEVPADEHLRGIHAADGSERPNAVALMSTDYGGLTAATAVELVRRSASSEKQQIEEVSA